MPITLLDGILLAFTLVSAMLAMVRGVSRELLSIGSWAIAALAAWVFAPTLLPKLQPYIAPYSDSATVAMIASGLIIFLIALIVATIITMKISDLIIDSRVGALDRTLGFVFGVARGVIVVAVGLLFFTWLAQSNMPGWVANAKSKPLLDSVGLQIKGVGTWIESMLPESLMPNLSGDDAPAEGNGAPPADAPAQGSGEPPAEDGADKPATNN